MSKPPSHSYFRVEFSCADAEEYSWQLIELGAEGLEIQSPVSVTAYLQAFDTHGAQSFADRAAVLGFRKKTIEAVPNLNWTQLAQELLEPVRVGMLTIDPIVDALSAIDSCPPNSIRLVPGQGFGTGHHPSTRQALLLLQHPELRGRVSTVLDFGTGSGILAVAAVKLFDAEVLAIDIAADALVNAETNIGLNGLEGRVRLQHSGAEAVTGSYDLITANIYAELLIEFEPVFRRASRRLICAGVLEGLTEQVLRAYRPHWHARSSAVSEGWSGLYLERRKEARLQYDGD